MKQRSTSSLIFLDMQFDIGQSTFMSWRVFLLICALPLVVSMFGLLIMPESPRYLLQVYNIIIVVVVSFIRSQ